MSKSKRSHHRSEEKIDETDDPRAIQSDASIEQKKSKKKSAKKSKKHRLKRKATPSDSDSDSSSSSSSESSSSSSEEETVKRKKQKKHKKSKRRNKHESVEKVSKSSRAANSDEEEDVKVLNEPARVHYVSSGEEERHRKASRRSNDKKKPREMASNERTEYKSKWDSPNDDFDRKRPRDVQQSDRRIEDRGRFEQRRFGAERERGNNNRDNHRERDNRQLSPQRERPDRSRNDRRPNDYRERNFRGGNVDWRPRDREFRDKDRRPDNNADRFKRPEPAGRRNISPRNNFRFGDEKRNDRYGDDKRNDDRRRPNFEARNFERNSQPNDRNRSFRRDGNDARDGNRMQSNERDRRPSPFRRDNVRSPPARERSPVHDRASPVRDNPFRRNNHLNKPSDFRPEAERPDRNDSREPSRGKRKKLSARDSDGENHDWGKPEDKVKKESDEPPPAEKEKPNFGLSGKLTEDTNTVNGVVIKYAEPQEARRPKRRWRLYPFKGEEALQTLHIHRQSCYLIGRDKKVCELAVDHPSCSKQHAALQYRLVPYERKDGSTGKRVKPYIIDLGSANGTFLNNKPIEPKKYYELFEKDMLKFGFSSREYVLLAEDSDVRDGEQIDEEYEPIKEEK